MNTTKKLVIAVVALSLALACVVGGTLAFLVAQSDVVTNTFSYGDITLKLWENEKSNETGKSFDDVIPGTTVDKDPYVTVVGESEACYVYVLVDNQLGNAVAYTVESTWEKVSVDEFENTTKALYRYKTKVEKTSQDQDLLVFNDMTFDRNLDKTALDGLADKKVILKAYAHQALHADGTIADAAAIAWAKSTDLG